MNVLLILLLTTVLVFSTEMLLEAENFTDRYKVVYRSNASNYQTARLHEGSFVNITFCLSKTTEIAITDIVTSNDGPTDNITVYLDLDYKGMVTSSNEASAGLGWNNFKSSGPVAGKLTLLQGNHSLVINISSSDIHGVEIDFVEMNVTGEISGDLFYCTGICFDHIDNIHRKSVANVTKGLSRIAQFSHKTTCAEEDNVIVPFHIHPEAEFEIKAMHPKYISRNNNRRPDFATCTMAKTILWSFNNITFPSMYLRFNSSDATLFLISSINEKKLEVHFSHGSEEIGSILRLSMFGLLKPVRIGMWFKMRSGEKSKLHYLTYLPSDKEIIWNIPDFTWRYGMNAVVGLVFPAVGHYLINEIQLHPRSQVLDKFSKIYDNGNLLIEGVKVDFWWKKNTDMKITRVDTGETYSEYNFIRFYTQVPWSTNNSYSQVFVLYSDGYSRILPITPPGLDWIPFGSSLLIGRSDPTLKRPSADISHLYLDPAGRNLTIHYVNHDEAFLYLNWTVDETIIKVDHVTFQQNATDLPILTFRSMWVSDGNADVDSVKVDNTPSLPILSDWQELNGSSFTFYRRCVSSHNTLSPDITVNILEP